MERQHAVNLVSDLLERLTSVALGLDEDARLDFVTDDQIEALDHLIQIVKAEHTVSRGNICDDHAYYDLDGGTYNLNISGSAAILRAVSLECIESADYQYIDTGVSVLNSQLHDGRWALDASDIATPARSVYTQY